MNLYGEVLENVSLKDYNTYKIGGKTRYLVKPYNIDSLKELLNYIKNNNMKYMIIGNGSNIILPDSDYNGVVILLSKLNEIKIDENTVNAFCGVPLTYFVNELVKNNLGGLESLSGIPGTLGGAIFNNAGCYGQTISDKLDSVTYLENGEIKTINKEECNFSYRDSIFKQNKNFIILSAKFKLNYKNKEEMINTIKENMIKRNTSQPLNYPNAGSVFRNPTGYSAGKLIEDAGLKNYHINGAYVSDKHANFIINKDNASSADIIELIEYIQKEISEKYNIKLKLEQEIIKY